MRKDDIEVEFGLQCENRCLQNRLTNVYSRLPKKLHFEPMQWGRNKSTEPISCNICLQNHPVNECEVYKCRHCGMFHPAFGNCSLHNQRGKKRDVITLMASKVKNGVFNEEYGGSKHKTMPASNEPYDSLEYSSNMQWRRARKGMPMGSSFNKRHWKRNRF